MAVEREPLLFPSRPNEVWSMDFVMDALSSGRRLKCLTVVDDFTKETLVLDHSISGEYVTRALNQRPTTAQLSWILDISRQLSLRTVVKTVHRKPTGRIHEKCHSRNGHGGHDRFVASSEATRTGSCW